MTFPTDLPTWTHRPNWAERVRATYDFKTSVFASRDGSETQRSALRETPRRSLGFSPLHRDDESRKMRRFLARHQSSEIAMADYSMGVSVSSGAMIGGSSLTLRRSAYWVSVGARVFLQDGPVIQLLTIATVAGLTVSFASEFTHAWSARTRVYPPLRGVLKDSLGVQSITDEVDTTTIDFDVTPGSIPPRNWGAAPTTLGGREVMTLRPNWTNRLDTDFVFPRERVDYGRGLVRVLRPVSFGTQIRRGRFRLRSAEQIDLLIGMFHRAKGQRGELYVSTWLNDMQLRLTANAGAAALRMQGVALHQTYASDPSYKAIEMRLSDGSVLRRLVTASATVSDANGADTILTVNSALPVAVSPAGVKSISWLQCARFATDTLTLDYVTDLVADVALTFQSLKDLTPEAA